MQLARDPPDVAPRLGRTDNLDELLTVRLVYDMSVVGRSCCT